MAQPTILPPLVRGEWVPMTYVEWAAWIPDGMQGEWVDGRGIVFVPPTKEHQQGAIFLTELIGRYARLFGLGEVVIAPYEMRLRGGAARPEPDVLYVAAEHASRWQGARLVGPADLVVEVVSDDSAGRDRREKFAEYEAAGIPEYLIVDRRRRPGQFDFFRLDERRRYQPVAPDEHGRYHSAVLPGFWLDPRWFWREPLPDVEDLLLAIAPDAYEAWLTAKLRAHRRPGDPS